MDSKGLCVVLVILLIIQSNSYRIKGPVPGLMICQNVAHGTKLPNNNDCGSFYVCTLGIAQLILCDEGLHFDRKINVCNWPEYAQCVLTSDPPPFNPPSTIENIVSESNFKAEEDTTPLPPVQSTEMLPADVLTGSATIDGTVSPTWTEAYSDMPQPTQDPRLTASPSDNFELTTEVREYVDPIYSDSSLSGPIDISTTTEYADTSTSETISSLWSSSYPSVEPSTVSTTLSPTTTTTENTETPETDAPTVSPIVEPTDTTHLSTVQTTEIPQIDVLTESATIDTTTKNQNLQLTPPSTEETSPSDQVESNTDTTESTVQSTETSQTPAIDTAIETTTNNQNVPPTPPSTEETSPSYEVQSNTVSTESVQSTEKPQTDVFTESITKDAPIDATTNTEYVPPTPPSTEENTPFHGEESNTDATESTPQSTEIPQTALDPESTTIDTTTNEQYLPTIPPSTEENTPLHEAESNTDAAESTVESTEIPQTDVLTESAVVDATSSNENVSPTRPSAEATNPSDNIESTTEATPETTSTTSAINTPTTAFTTTPIDILLTEPSEVTTESQYNDVTTSNSKEEVTASNAYTLSSETTDTPIPVEESTYLSINNTPPTEPIEMNANTDGTSHPAPVTETNYDNTNLMNTDSWEPIDPIFYSEETYTMGQLLPTPPTPPPSSATSRRPSPPTKPSIRPTPPQIKPSLPPKLYDYDPNNIRCLHDGLYFLPHPTKCELYFICASRNLTMHHCGNGVHWDYLIEQCGIPAGSHCYFNDFAPIMETSSQPTPVTTLKRTSTPAVIPSPTPPMELLPKCPPYQSFIPYKRDCRKYYICIGGLPILTSCPDNLYWDSKGQFCGDSTKTDCLRRQ